ncbi:hypothetical protein B9Q13_01000 [Candidatus Marsarchaeota G2 archaeon ECH_B_SAG-G16]|uniref:Tricorn protease homolog n=1 Tax=Candidatus Marsarchaeota G2 archaeon ECH_B_SAG-G16 TaxID=1978167 RepID=A0A2R6C4F9_9ARCH|nr:MAG: hypothetical protein B9Q13_01000 [Candidatus Marsarchaeota G2 archaeon ECH_B_SAG-G16]
MDAYILYPTIHERKLAFVAEDDLWLAELPEDPEREIVARRITNALGVVSNPRFSPDGRYIAFRLLQGSELQVAEVYTIPVEGGIAKRLTYFGSVSTNVAGWTPDNKVVVSTDAKKPFRTWSELWKIDPEGGAPEPLPYGRANMIVFGERIVLGRNCYDLTYWKRYKGGARGKLWIQQPNGGFKKLELNGNINSPMWVNGRVYFVSDHEGVGNLYSVNPEGDDLRRHTNHKEYYVRNANSDGLRIVYHVAGYVYLFEPLTEKERRLKIKVLLSGKHSSPRFVDPARFMEEFTLHPKGHTISVTTRGKSFVMGNWEGPVLKLSQDKKAERLRLSRFLSTGHEVVAVSDETGEERLVFFDLKTGERTLLDFDFGHIESLKCSPKKRRVALTNNRFELWLVDFEQKPPKSTLLDKSEYGVISDVDWSPDGEWLAYSFPENLHASSIRLACASGKVVRVTTPTSSDFSPSFDPEGKYLYYLSRRSLDPVYDKLVFDLSFPKPVKPFLVVLKKGEPSPFTSVPQLSVEEQSAKEQAFSIDIEGLENRIEAFPVEEANYVKIWGSQKGRVFLLSFPVEGAIKYWLFSKAKPGGVIEVFDISTRSKEVFLSGVSDFEGSMDRSTVAIRVSDKIRVVSALEKPQEQPPSEFSKKTGWVDLSRIKPLIDPRLEWKQMLRETWRLMRENYWREDLSGVDWNAIYERYSKLVERVSTRFELSDVIRELQGEMGTSHAYEIGGDLMTGDAQPVGGLGIEHRWASDGYEITRFYVGDPANEGERSPLLSAGVDAQLGDKIVAINGITLTKELTPEAALWNIAGELVTLKLKRGDKVWDVVVRTLRDERQLIYRAWVERNRRYVHEKSKGRLGYVHIPDMGPRGFAEFNRLFPLETEKDGLIVDVRFNGGGHVSQLILEKLMRKRIGYDKPRRGKPEPYPSDSVKGPIVVITNEQAGSDGDIFTHSFKLLSLGPVIGTRTWGGVIGINPRISLVDGTFVTQPQFAFWFKDVGWGVENYGTDPTIEVEITPEDYMQGRDPQLDRAIEEALKLLSQVEMLEPPSD